MSVRGEPKPKISAYLEAGAPTKCFLPNCRKPFNGAAIHGRDGHYYCSENCVAVGVQSEAHVEEFRSKANSPSASHKKLSAR
jgi:hypothetical protein